MFFIDLHRNPPISCRALAHLWSMQPLATAWASMRMWPTPMPSAPSPNFARRHSAVC